MLNQKSIGTKTDAFFDAKIEVIFTAFFIFVPQKRTRYQTTKGVFVSHRSAEKLLT